MPETAEIALGARKFQIRKLTLRQLRDLEIGDATGIEVTPSGATPPPGATPDQAAAAMLTVSEGSSFAAILSGRFRRSMAVVLAALGRDYPDVTEASILDQDDIGPDDIHIAAGQVRMFSGMKLVPLAAAADQTPAATGTTSTAS